MGKSPGGGGVMTGCWEYSILWPGSAYTGLTLYYSSYHTRFPYIQWSLCLLWCFYLLVSVELPWAWRCWLDKCKPTYVYGPHAFTRLLAPAPRWVQLQSLAGWVWVVKTPVSEGGGGGEKGQAIRPIRDQGSNLTGHVNYPTHLQTANLKAIF